ncbi:hypothetical protein [Helicobacter pylori]|uniref:hypothetical protein n=1 Tax=Helicobacter pylori TaxID=210 RepID=UPI001FD2F379|nr:hypothetical protein [Helicobacter pylori]UOR63163.1 hypothetical protein MPG55_05305 [Helicobacter pylori]
MGNFNIKNAKRKQAIKILKKRGLSQFLYIYFQSSKSDQNLKDYLSQFEKIKKEVFPKRSAVLDTKDPLKLF